MSIDFRSAVHAEVISEHEAALIRDAIREVAPGKLEVDHNALDWAGRIAWGRVLKWREECVRCGK